MKKMLGIVQLLATLTILTFAFAQGNIDWAAVDEAMGVSGQRVSDEVYKYTMPRTDLNVTASEMQVDPHLALGSWVAFNPVTETEVIIMGDLVLTGDEYNEVISILQEGGIGQTAIHKHLPDVSTPIWWTHIEARGEPAQLAQTINKALQQTGTPLGEQEGGNEEAMPLDTNQLDEIIGYQGSASGGVYKYSIPRVETFTARGITIPPPMGTVVALGFQPLGDGRAAINGDFIMRPYEIDRVIRALRDNNITVVSLHNHMTRVEPEVYFMHFWAEGDAADLARGLRAALNEVDVVGPPQGQEE